jgi:hypothetical protein
MRLLLFCIHGERRSDAIQRACYGAEAGNGDGYRYRGKRYH